jgi:Tfp pilus assembly protein PilP
MNALNPFACTVVLAAAGIVFIPAAYGASDLEAKQMTEDFSPQAQARLATREAQAAYQDAVSNCKTMKGADRNSCMKEARANLQTDISNAKKMQGSGH